MRLAAALIMLAACDVEPELGQLELAEQAPIQTIAVRARLIRGVEDQRQCDWPTEVILSLSYTFDGEPTLKTFRSQCVETRGYPLQIDCQHDYSIADVHYRQSDRLVEYSPGRLRLYREIDSERGWACMAMYHGQIWVTR